MDSTKIYLKSHYFNKSELAQACSITVDELDQLITEELIPEPSYVVTEEGKLISQAFGELSAHDALPGQYFHRQGTSWVTRALDAKKALGAFEAKQSLKLQFTSNFAAALKKLDSALFRLPDSFTDAGEIIQDGLLNRTNLAWNYFLKGVFNLCVANPSTEVLIAEKEILQEALTKLSDNGAKADFTQSELSIIFNLIKLYSCASMPFSPQEYPRSSRKRLVEDLTTNIEKQNRVPMQAV